MMKDMGSWTGKVIDNLKSPIVSEDGKVSFFNAKAAGVFIPKVKHCDMVKAGDVLGSIVNPLTAEVVDEIASPCNGLIFTLREYPVVDEGSLIARILEM